jgi:DNA-binding PadR family transcriptional regulator
LLYRLEKRGWIAGHWVEKSGQKRRRGYKLTKEGKQGAQGATQYVAIVRGGNQPDHGIGTCLTGNQESDGGC